LCPTNRAPESIGANGIGLAVWISDMEQSDTFPSSGGTLRYAQAPFFRRVQGVIANWIATEWETRESIRQEAASEGWDDARRKAYDHAILDAHTLARAIDNISLTKLRRELNKLGAPPPGQLIRDARIAHAKHLLVTGRLLIREVADRVGYTKEKAFTQVFTESVGVTPSEYRRLSVTGGIPPASVD